MRIPFTRNAKLGVAGGLATLLVGGALFGASALAQSTPPGQPGRPGAAEHQKREAELVQKVAAKLGKTEDQVRSAIIAAKQEMVDDAVKAGRLTQQQGDAIKQRIQQSGGLGGLHAGGPGGRRGGPGGPMRGAIASTAEQYLGLKPEELRAQLQAGKSLADITRERGKDLNTLKAQLAAAMKSRIDAAVTAGRLPKDRADAMKADVDKRVDKIVNRKFGQGAGPGQRRGGQ